VDGPSAVLENEVVAVALQVADGMEAEFAACIDDSSAK